jgi:hypothetical protein
MHHNKQISESINQKIIWDLIRDESGESEKKTYAPIVINKNRNLISEPKHGHAYMLTPGM